MYPGVERQARGAVGKRPRERQRPAEVLERVDRMLAVFGQLRIEREALAAVIVLRRAVAQGTATAALARQAATLLTRFGQPPAGGAKP